ACLRQLLWRPPKRSSGYTTEKVSTTSLFAMIRLEISAAAAASWRPRRCFAGRGRRGDVFGRLPPVAALRGGVGVIEEEYRYERVGYPIIASRSPGISREEWHKKTLVFFWFRPKQEGVSFSLYVSLSFQRQLVSGCFSSAS
ncbi:hypothetical protein LCGC14_2908160, partial [marine sediment metagenome]